MGTYYKSHMTIKSKDEEAYHDVRKVFHKIEEYCKDNNLDKDYEDTDTKLLDDITNNIYFHLYGVYKFYKTKMKEDTDFISKEFIFKEEEIYMELRMKYHKLDNWTMQHIEQSFQKLSFNYIHYVV